MKPSGSPWLAATSIPPTSLKNSIQPNAPASKRSTLPRFPLLQSNLRLLRQRQNRMTEIEHDGDHGLQLAPHGIERSIVWNRLQSAITRPTKDGAHPTETINSFGGNCQTHVTGRQRQPKRQSTALFSRRHLAPGARTGILFGGRRRMARFYRLTAIIARYVMITCQGRGFIPQTLIVNLSPTAPHRAALI